MSMDENNAGLNTAADAASAQSPGSVAGPSSRRRLLQLGAIAAPAAMMLKPGHAWAASVFQCTVLVPPILGLVNGTWVPIRSVPSVVPGQAMTYVFDFLGGSGTDAGLQTVAQVDTGGASSYTGEQLKNNTFSSAAHPGQYAFLLTLQTGQGLSCLASVGFGQP